MKEAAGFIVFRETPDGPRFLLLRNARHRTWGFPKGHLEPGESAEGAARRELAEETGIESIQAIDGIQIESVYKLPGTGADDDDDDGEERPTKRVVYFLGSVDAPDFWRSREHDAGGWVSPEEAIALFGHEDLKRVLREALAHMRGL